MVLAESPFRAEDREELHAEDFWIVGPEGDVARAEVKGQNTNVRRDDVNQVDSHREALGDAAAELPGLLIVNIFRGHANLEQRQLPVSQDVARRAATSDVLVLRTIDLYNLIALKMSGSEAATAITENLGAGGGWLEVTAEGRVELHT